MEKPANPAEGNYRAVYDKAQRDMLKWVIELLQLYGGHTPIYYAQGRQARFDIPWEDWLELKKLAEGEK